MKSCGLVGCVVLFLFSILHEAHQQDVCSEYAEYNIEPVRHDEPTGRDVQIDVRRIAESSLPDGACFLVAYKPRDCGPIYLRGSVLLTDNLIHEVDIMSYSRNLEKSWLSRVTIQRVSDTHHIYRMKFVAAFTWNESNNEFVPFNVSSETMDRFNSHYAILGVDEERVNYAMKICDRSTTISQNRSFITEGGCLLKQHPVRESVYVRFRVRIPYLFRYGYPNPLMKISTDVPALN